MTAAELLELLQTDPLTTDDVPPADGLQRRGVFIMPTCATMPAYRAHFAAQGLERRQDEQIKFDER